jgi:hypothetical protein
MRVQVKAQLTQNDPLVRKFPHRDRMAEMHVRLNMRARKGQRGWQRL